MSRSLHWVNLLGVLALAALCVVQWRVNRQLNLELNRREQARLQLAARMDEQARTCAGQTTDLAGLRTHLARLTQELAQTAAKLAAAERELSQSMADCDQLKSSVTNWAAAVATRDERLRQAASQLEALADERADAVKRFNDLAQQHNKLVGDFDEVRQRLRAALTHATPPPQPR